MPIVVGLMVGSVHQSYAFPIGVEVGADDFGRVGAGELVMLNALHLLNFDSEGVLVHGCVHERHSVLLQIVCPFGGGNLTELAVSVGCVVRGSGAHDPIDGSSDMNCYLHP
ncbi:hypothetical protein FRX31_031499 [Thalictrum thalictroides]|uniref:Uncharacterized protein n=1 Tax=Thalictrum thalictroides TaxID=46969 RepID=A0A7J6V1Q8_THATH|nr:hypothetical protein FRX31_031499 [Thalictrum thalictroides]